VNFSREGSLANQFAKGKAFKPAQCQKPKKRKDKKVNPIIPYICLNLFADKLF
jgi:hypothetical protein